MGAQTSLHVYALFAIVSCKLYENFVMLFFLFIRSMLLFLLRIENERACVCVRECVCVRQTFFSPLSQSTQTMNPHFGLPTMKRR